MTTNQDMSLNQKKGAGDGAAFQAFHLFDSFLSLAPCNPLN
ncbi:hypothetical protein [Paenibacillus chibensis]|nr:hypothetical protein [Paenibacillus chibensis]MEC0371799.1 hypothetical protein [Paenibacillus chibensis]